MTIQSDSGRANSLTDWTSEISGGWNYAGILSSLFSRQAETLTVLPHPMLTMRYTSVDSTSPARPVIGQLFLVLGVDTTLPQVVFKAILKAFSLPPLVTSSIGQFTI